MPSLLGLVPNRRDFGIVYTMRLIMYIPAGLRMFRILQADCPKPSRRILRSLQERADQSVTSPVTMKTAAAATFTGRSGSWRPT